MKHSAGILVTLLFSLILVNVFVTGCGNLDNFQDSENYTDTAGKEIEVSISGCAQKGQFVKGSQLVAYSLDDKLVASGHSFPGNISDDMGNFTISGKTGSPFVELRAEGYYFNEVSGQLEGPLYLDALLEPSTKSLNINVLTTIIKPRVQRLILSGMSYDAAVKMAQEEFLNALGYDDLQLIDFAQMDITKSSDSNAFLLALACILQVNRDSAQTSFLIQVLAMDMEDGVLEPDVLAILKDSAKAVNASEVCTNLKTFYQANGITAAIPEFWNFLNDAPQDSYTSVLSCKIIKGILADPELRILDSECDQTVADAFNSKYGEIIRIITDETDAFEFEFDLNNPKRLYGDFELEVTTFGNEIRVTSPRVSISTEEKEENIFVHRIKSSKEIKESHNINLYIGDTSYNLFVEDGGSLDQLDYAQDMCCLFIGWDMGGSHSHYYTRINDKFYKSFALPWSNAFISFVPMEQMIEIEVYDSVGYVYRADVDGSNHIRYCNLERSQDLRYVMMHSPKPDILSKPDHITVNGDVVPVYYYDSYRPTDFLFVYNMDGVKEINAEYEVDGVKYIAYGVVGSDGLKLIEWLDRPLNEYKRICFKDPYDTGHQYYRNFYIYYNDSNNQKESFLYNCELDNVYTALVPIEASEFVSTYMDPFINLPEVNGKISSYMIEYNGRSYYEVIWDVVDNSIFTTITIDMTAIPDGYDYILQIFNTDETNLKEYLYAYANSIGGNTYSYRILPQPEYRLVFDVAKQIEYPDGVKGNIPYGIVEKIYKDNGSGKLNVSLKLSELKLY